MSDFWEFKPISKKQVKKAGYKPVKVRYTEIDVAEPKKKKVGRKSKKVDNFKRLKKSVRLLKKKKILW